MAAWRDFFTTGNNSDALPEWMSQNVGTAAAQVIRYPQGAPYYYEHGHYGGEPRAPHHHRHGHYPEHYRPDPQANYRAYREEATSFYSSKEYTVELLRVPICCEGCVERAKSGFIKVDGVRAVSVDQERKMVTVTGTPELQEVLNACKKIFKRSQWRPTR